MSRQQTTGAAWRAAANRFRPAPPLEGLRDYQKPPTDPHTTGHVLVAGRGAGKSYAAAKYLGWLAQNTAKLRARIIAPTLGDAVATALDPQSGIVAQYPDARFTGGTRGTRVVFPNGSQIFLVGTPTARDVDRLRALTSIDVDHFEEAAANPQLGGSVQAGRVVAARHTVTETSLVGDHHTTNGAVGAGVVERHQRQNLCVPRDHVR